MKNVIVFGGSGLVGKAISVELKKYDKYEVFLTYKSKYIQTAKSYKLDIQDLAGLQQMLKNKQPEIVISCLRGEFDKQLTFHKSLAEYLSKNGGKLYFFSTTNVFDGEVSKPHYEDDIPKSDTDYGKFKIECEKRLSKILKENLIILRIPQVWGKDSPRMKQLIEAQYNSQKIKVYPGVFVNTNTDAAIAEKTKYIIDRDMRGIFHLTSEDMIDYKEMYKQLIIRLGLENVNFDEEIDEEGYFAILSKRQREFPKDMQITNEEVIEYLTK